MTGAAVRRPSPFQTMKVADNYQACVPFFEQLKRTSRRVLMLDYDGTLSPFTPDRTRAFPYREIPEAVMKIMRAETRVVLVSGRAATDLVFLSGIKPHPEIWGSHGAERLYPNGCYEVESPSAQSKTGFRLADRALRAAGLADRMEVKPTSIAVHWRGLPKSRRNEISDRVRQVCAPAIDDYGLQLLSFDGGLELRVPGKNKGDAVNTVLSEAGNGVAAAYLGDDQTDEDAFRAIKGRGLAVLVRPEPRPSVADAWLRPPEELSRFLRDWLAASGAEHES